MVPTSYNILPLFCDLLLAVLDAPQVGLHFFPVTLHMPLRHHAHRGCSPPRGAVLVELHEHADGNSAVQQPPRAMPWPALAVGTFLVFEAQISPQLALGVFPDPVGHPLLDTFIFHRKNDG
jgi:hypothetical protein